ncbi:oligopeptide transport ATP-binding protein oppF [Vibrio sp. JCM 19236]|nr:oligopeptide transport ATP-binding protein oppF [Vibrio sp. JCM 19236]
MAALKMVSSDRTEPLLKVSNLAKRYPVGDKWLQAFFDISFEIKRGQCLALVGESGCGKSSIAMSILKLVSPDSGVIEFEGTDLCQLEHKELQALRKSYGIVFQNPYSSLNPRLNVLRLVEEPF